jgi:hypothetical protein
VSEAHEYTDVVVTWHPYNWNDKEATKPPKIYTLYWIKEDQEDEITMGYFDGFTWHLWGGSDDCSASAWAEITYPGGPA